MAKWIIAICLLLLTCKYACSDGGTADTYRVTVECDTTWVEFRFPLPIQGAMTRYLYGVEIVDTSLSFYEKYITCDTIWEPYYPECDSVWVRQMVDSILESILDSALAAWPDSTYCAAHKRWRSMTEVQDTLGGE